ncbi:MAG: hypothetical protein PHU51_06280 [Candidatus Nanoarchaeia archaeon]|nr:hypothetical protein [Candidatus Nanoarchaeia archaeon]
MKIKTKEKTYMKECCRECGFPIDMERKPVFLTKNSLDLLEHERNKCQTCGHQKSGWTIPSAYEHIQKILKLHREKSITKDKIREAIDKCYSYGHAEPLTEYYTNGKNDNLICVAELLEKLNLGEEE